MALKAPIIKVLVISCCFKYLYMDTNRAIAGAIHQLYMDQAFGQPLLFPYAAILQVVEWMHLVKYLVKQSIFMSVLDRSLAWLQDLFFRLPGYIHIS